MTFDDNGTELARLRSEVAHLRVLAADWRRAYTSILMGLPDADPTQRLLARVLDENAELRRRCEDLERNQR